MTSSPAIDVRSRPSSDHHRGERVVQIVAGVVVVWLSLVLAIVEAFLVPLRVGGTRVPVSVLLAVAANLVLPFLMLWLTRSRLAATLPAVVWFVLILVFSGGTPEGDVVLAGNDWVALVLLLAGSAAAAAGVYFALLGSGRRSLHRMSPPQG